MRVITAMGHYLNSYAFRIGNGGIQFATVVTPLGHKHQVNDVARIVMKQAGPTIHAHTATLYAPDILKVGFANTGTLDWAGIIEFDYRIYRLLQKYDDEELATPAFPFTVAPVAPVCDCGERKLQLGSHASWCKTNESRA